MHCSIAERQAFQIQYKCQELTEGWTSFCAALLIFFVFLTAKCTHEDYLWSASEERQEVKGNWASFHISFKIIIFSLIFLWTNFYTHPSYKQKRCNSGKDQILQKADFFFPVGFLGSLSAPLDLALPSRLGLFLVWMGAASHCWGRKHLSELSWWCTLSPHSSSWLHSPVLILGLVLVEITLHLVIFLLI